MKKNIETIAPFLKYFLLLFAFITSSHICFSQKQPSADLMKRIEQMRKQRLEREKQNSSQSTAKSSSYNNGMGGKISFTPKVNIYSNPTTVVTIIAGTAPGKIFNFEYATDDCSMWGIGMFPSGQITSDLYYDWDVSYDNGVTWQLGAGGCCGASLQLGILNRSAVYRRYCFPWDWQGSITNDCGDMLSNNVYINVLPVNSVLKGGKISSSNTTVSINASGGLINSDSLATGGTSPYSYSWQKQEDNNGVWSVITGETNATLNVGALVKPTSFKRKVIDTHGDSAFSNIVTIYTQPFAIKGGLIGEPVTICSGDNISLNNIIAACGGVGNITYSWEYNIGSGWISIANSNTATLTVNNVTQNTTYRRKATDEIGNFVYCNEVQVLVYPPIVGGTITPATQTICSNGSIVPQELKLVDYDHYTTGVITYQWQKATNLNGPWTDLIGVTGSTYLPKIATQTLYYRVKATSSNCNMVNYSSVATVLVNNICRVIAPNSNKQPKR